MKEELQKLVNYLKTLAGNEDSASIIINHNGRIRILVGLKEYETNVNELDGLFRNQDPQ